MKINDYINNLITNKSPYYLTTENEKTIQFEGIEKYIYKVLNNHKYKCTKTTENYDNIVKNIIRFSVQNKLPIHLDLSTGATKNPNAISSPGIDWAEVFNIAFIREYLKPIAVAYKHGVVLDYFSVAVFEDKVNHIPQADIEAYDKQFSELINVYQNYLPNNLKIRYSRLSDRGSKENIYMSMDKKISELRRNWPSLSNEAKSEKLRRAERNIYLTGNEPDKDALILTSALSHDAFGSECWSDIAKPIWHEEDDISLGHRYTDGWAIHIKSAPGSTVNYWSGTGVLVRKGNTFVPTVLSPKQYDEISDRITIFKDTFFKSNKELSEKLDPILVAPTSGMCIKNKK